MGLMMLAASKGCEITVETSGNQATELSDAIKALVGDYFGEGK
jgi:phosphocarrier protein